MGLLLRKILLLKLKEKAFSRIVDFRNWTATMMVMHDISAAYLKHRLELATCVILYPFRNDCKTLRHKLDCAQSPSGYFN
jgi:hypothetical protein